MKYNNISEGIFISRPNRFIAQIMIGNQRKICHVKNTGRCKELLTEGVRIIVEKSDNPLRKTEYDLIAVYKNGKLINIDSQAPNKVFGEWIVKGQYFKNIKLLKPECKYKNSRFDFYIETESRRIFAEVKGVTLENDGVVLFPDAPTERGIKHINELIDAVLNGYESYVFFVVQMSDCKYFTPNKATHPEFAAALKTASENGVNICCMSCTVTQDTLNIDKPVNIVL